MSIVIPEGYRSPLGIYDTQMAIGLLHRLFEDNLAAALNLSRVSAPLFVDGSTGLNDNLTGVEQGWNISLPANDGVYISEEEYAGLDAGVRDFEPRSALVPGPEGMEHPRAVEEAARRLLRPGGLFLMEHGWLQGEACRALCHEDFWKDVHTGLDLAGRDRFLFAVRTEKK